MTPRWAIASLCWMACGGSSIEVPGDGDGTSTLPTTGSPGLTPTPTDGVPEMLAAETYEDTTNNGGIVKVKVEVSDPTTAFMVTGQSKKKVSLERILDPNKQVVLDWQDWWNSDESLTNAIYGFDKTTAVNWPIRSQDGPLAPGVWTVELSTLENSGNYAPNSDITLTVHTKADDDLTRATARVAILWADGMDGKTKVVSAVERAVERWREVWALYGLTLEESYHPSALDPNLTFTYTGSDTVAEATAGLPAGTLVLVVGEAVLDEFSTFGVSAGIPGTLTSSPMTFVVLAWTSHAGANGTFDDDEIRLMGETMAHEVGHYTGLFHPVEWDYNFWDALEDTPSCTSWQTCDSALGANLMYPYPICDFNSCAPQDQLTEDQRAVAHRYTGML